MNKITERRLKENEVIFREANSDIAKFVEEETGSEQQQIAFYCECSKKSCRQRIRLTTSSYGDAHANRRQFITLPGHEHPVIEVIVKRENGFNVVEKLGPMPKAEDIDLALHQSLA